MVVNAQVAALNSIIAICVCIQLWIYIYSQDIVDEDHDDALKKIKQYIHLLLFYREKVMT